MQGRKGHGPRAKCSTTLEGALVPQQGLGSQSGLPLKEFSDGRLPHCLGCGSQWEPSQPVAFGVTLIFTGTLTGNEGSMQILLWAEEKLLSLKPVYIPVYANLGADILSRQGLSPGEWRLHT